MHAQNNCSVTMNNNLNWISEENRNEINCIKIKISIDYKHKNDVVIAVFLLRNTKKL